MTSGQRGSVGHVAVRRIVLATLLGAIGLFLATSALGGELRGTVIVPPGGTVQRAAFNPYPGIAGTSGPAVDIRPRGPQDVIVYLTGPNVVAQSDRSRGTSSLSQINKCFQPRVLGISVGTSVDFPNEDVVFHNVFSYSKTKKFDLGYYGKGKAKRVTFNKPGLVKVFCDIHSSMSAFILVVDTPFITKPDGKGNYAFDNLTDGTYTVNYWHPEYGERSEQVTIGSDVAHSNARF